MRILICLVSACFFMTSIAGCEDNSKKLSPTEQLVKLRQAKKQTDQQLANCQADNLAATEQFETLSRLDTDDRLENIYQTSRIKITRYTNLYDKDKDSMYEKLIVYIQPIDQEGDIVKATGAVDVQLWDINNPDDKALIGQWKVNSSQLRKLWFDTIVTINYRLEFDLDEKLEKPTAPLTVKVVFTDYITGKTFNEQKIIKP